MLDEIERRLADAAVRLREYDVTTQRCTDLRARAALTEDRVHALRETYAAEQRDVEKLESMSLTRIVAALRGARADDLARERAEADAARYRVAEAQARLDVIHRELAAARARLEQLGSAPRTYAAVLADKEAYLTGTGDRRGARLLDLADERGRLDGELQEVAEAVAAADRARAALGAVLDRLDSAHGWSTYDTFFGGGVVGSAIKHSRLDEAAQAARYADGNLAVLRTELADVPGVGVTAPALAVDGLTRFLDVWFDNIFTDLAVRDRIKRAQQQTAHCAARVDDVLARLRQRAAAGRARLSEIEAERRGLLVG